MKNEKKSIQNIKYILNKNMDFIEQIVASEDFLNEINKYPDIINIEVVENDNTGESLLLEKIPTVVSSYITKNAMLEMKNGETIVIKYK